MNYRQLAKECPHCMGCGLESPNGDLLCLAHSNSQKHGRGFAHKSIDEMGAFLCMRCHDFYDKGDADRSYKESLFREWWQASIEWAITKKGWRLVRVE